MASGESTAANMKVASDAACLPENDLTNERYKLEHEGGRNYYVYIVEVCYDGRLHKIKRRYSAFHRFYKELEKSFITGDFPPKRIRATTHKVLELRRTGLEKWLQLVVKIQPIPTALLSFLDIENYCPPSQIETIEPEPTEELSHQPMLLYNKDPFLSPDCQPEYFSLQHFCSQSCSPLSNNVTRGVLMALYDPSLQFNL